MTPDEAQYALRAINDAISGLFTALDRRISDLEQKMRDRIMHELPDKDKGETP